MNTAERKAIKEERSATRDILKQAFETMTPYEYQRVISDMAGFVDASDLKEILVDNGILEVRS